MRNAEAPETCAIRYFRELAVPRCAGPIAQVLVAPLFASEGSRLANTGYVKTMRGPRARLLHVAPHGMGKPRGERAHDLRIGPALYPLLLVRTSKRTRAYGVQDLPYR